MVSSRGKGNAVRRDQVRQGIVRRPDMAMINSRGRRLAWGWLMLLGVQIGLPLQAQVRQLDDTGRWVELAAPARRIAWALLLKFSHRRNPSSRRERSYAVPVAPIACMM